MATKIKDKKKQKITVWAVRFEDDSPVTLNGDVTRYFIATDVRELLEKHLAEVLGDDLGKPKSRRYYRDGQGGDKEYSCAREKWDGFVAQATQQGGFGGERATDWRVSWKAYKIASDEARTLRRLKILG